MKTPEFLGCLVVIGIFVYVFWTMSCVRPSDDFEEAFEPFEPTPIQPATTTTGATLAPVDLQAAINLSDLIVTEEQRKEWFAHTENTKQIQSVNERFEAAKRRTEEHKLKPGVFTNERRRQLIEKLVRRPTCGKRRRGWRTEFSDIMRGDVIPKRLNESNFGVMQMGRKDPKVDLHPGALGPLSGLQGAWVSEENIAGNQFDDAEDIIAE